MLDCYVVSTQEKVIPIEIVITRDFREWFEKQNNQVKNWVTSTNFMAKPASVCYLGNHEGHVEKILLGISSPEDVWCLGALPPILPAGVYSIEGQFEPQFQELAGVAWGLGSYQFRHYFTCPRIYEAKLLLPKCNHDHIENVVRATYLVRDLINIPTEDMGPAQLADVAGTLAEEFNAKIKLIIGDQLLKKNYPAVHAVGRASVNAPRLIEINWGKKSDPHVCLIGKGVCFDTGGLDIKPPIAMRYMKKDMAGAAHVLGIARMVMSANLPIQLRILIPAVENSISSNAIRPGDVITMRNGMTVEVTNTDAEGRLILAEALTEAVTQQPDLIVDIATLTGAARVALGPEPGAYFTHDNALAEEIFECAYQEQDPLWRLPIYRAYRSLLDSPVADIVNADLDSVGGGAIMAALFLDEFVPVNIPWLHLDIMAYNLRSKPARPCGGEAMGMRAVFRYLEQKFGKK